MIKSIDMCYAVFEKLDDFSYKIIKNEIDSIRNNLKVVEQEKSADQVFAFQQRVIGALEYYQLPKSEELIKQRVLKLIEFHETRYKIFDRIHNFNTNLPDAPKLDFERIWINVQRKGEFIPLHQHSGIYSFVLWFEIPYYIEEERAKCTNKQLIKDRSGGFEFVHIDPLGHLVNHGLPVDKTWEGVLCVFPAEMHHQVYPFYSSDNLRITISGNIKLSEENFK